MILLTAQDGDEGVRADVFLTEAPELNLTRSAIKRLIEDGQVTLGRAAVKAGYRLRPGDELAVEVPEPSPVDAVAEDIPLDILYEDAALIVVNKPQGMVVHPSPGHGSGTLVNALLYHCGGSLSGIGGVLRPGIVHRIDRDTSGLLVAAKTDTAHAALSAQLAKRTVTRRYDAIVRGKITDSITIDKAIGRSRTDRKKMAVDPAGRRAITHVTPINVLFKRGTHSHIEARLETGRTHQIRVHMASIGKPVLGDPLYGGEEKGLNLPGQALHASTLGFIHPSTGVYAEFYIPPPACFLELLEHL